MKYLMTFLGLMLLSTVTFSQIVTLKELIEKSKCSSFSCFSNFITKKGFSYFDSPAQPAATMYIFSSNKKFTATSNQGVTVPDNSYIKFYKSGAVEVSISTAVASTYQKLMTELNALGYKEGSTFDSEGGMVQVAYNSAQYPNIPLNVATQAITKKELGSWTIYTYTMTRNLYGNQNGK